MNYHEEKQKNIQKSSNYQMIDHYLLNLLQVLGIGTYGKVFLGTDVRFDLTVAIKTIKFKNISFNTQKFLAALRNQIRNMQIVQHQNIVKLYDVKKSANHLYLICEYCNGGSLENLLKSKGKLPLQQVLRIMNSIISGYKCLLSHGLVHRDIKPANILLHNDIIKLADFGFSKLITDHDMEQRIMISRVGSPQYMSPQILKNQKYSSKCDIWSIGMIFYEAIFGRYPWTGDDMTNLCQKIMTSKLQFPQYPKLPKDIQKLIQRMLAINQTDRISWDSLIQQTLFGKMKNQNLVQTIVSLSKSPHINRFKQLLRIYFESNKYIKTIFQCQRKSNINKVVVNSKAQQNSQVLSTHSSHQSYEQIYCRQRKQIYDKKVAQKVFNYFIAKRNRCAFYSLLYINIIFNCQQYGLSSKQTVEYMFPILKLSTRTFYKIFQRLKNNQPQKYINFSQQQWSCFQRSGFRKTLTNFVNYDFTVQKLYFDDLLKRLLKLQQLQENKQKEFGLTGLSEILNNKICQKETIVNLIQKYGDEILNKLQKNKELIKSKCSFFWLRGEMKGDINWTSVYQQQQKQ